MFGGASRWTDIASALVVEASAWRLSVLHAAESESAVGALLLISALLVGLVGRSLSLLLAAVVVAVLSTCLLAAHAPEMRSILVTMAAAVQILLLLGGWTVRRQIRRLSREASILEAEKHKLTALLDREILWRKAAGE